MLTDLAAVAHRHSPPAAGLRIYLLGPLRIERDGVALALPRRKVEALLSYLLLHPEQHTRDHLATLLWGETADAKARHSLRTALATLRHHLAETLLLTDRDHVQLNPAFPLWVDLHEFLALGRQADLALLTADRLRAALALWQGELLAGSYEDWLLAEREQVHAQLLTSLLELIQELRARSAYALAIAVAQKVLAFDPAHEQAHQHLMFCYMAAGDRAAALRQYDLCEQALADELDVPPMAETTALYHWIRQQAGEANTLAAQITNLPIPLTSFVGRTQETAEVKQFLTQMDRGTRLLTLTGAGGSGKTRLAIQVATDLIDRFTAGVWWVELAALSEKRAVARAIANALSVRELAEQPLPETLVTYLRDKQLLLVLDNCEHLIEPCAQLVTHLLAHCPQLQILTTSREPLNVAGEIQWHVPPFATPGPTDLAQTDLVPRFDSLQLFVARAATVQPGFALTPENLEAVAEICRRLDGIPLALELAAARLKLLSVEQLAAYLVGELGARFALLTQGSRSALARHQTLRATLDWSYHLLDEAERRLFCQLAIFPGTFTVEAVDQIIGDAGNRVLSAVPALLHPLTQLVDKSLVVVESTAGQGRYRLLETLREYALEQIGITAEWTSLQARHAAYCLALAEQAAPHLNGTDQQAWLLQLETEHANLRGALGYLLTAADSNRALALATALARFWEVRGYVSEGREWLHKALAIAHTVPGLTRAKALNAAGYLALRQSDFAQAQPLLTASLSLFEQSEDEVGIADTLQNLATMQMNQGAYGVAQQLLERSLNLCRLLAYETGIARALNLLGNLAVDQDHYPAARDYYLESLHRYQRLGDQVSIATGFFNVGNTARALGDLAAARTNYEACLTISRTLGHKGLTGVALRNLGIVAFDQADYLQARRYGEEALHLLRELGDKVNLGFARLGLGDVAQKLGESQVALDHYAQTLQLLHTAGHKWGIFYTLETIAGLFVAIGRDPDDPVRLLAAAHTLRQATQTAIPPAEQTTYDARLHALRTQLGEERFADLWAQGQIMPLDALVATISALPSL